MSIVYFANIVILVGKIHNIWYNYKNGIASNHKNKTILKMLEVKNAIDRYI